MRSRLLRYFIFSRTLYIGCIIATAKKPTIPPIISIRSGSMIEERFLVI